MHLRWSSDPNPLNRKIIGNIDEIYVKRIGNAGTQGVQFLKDIRFIEKNFGIENTHSFYKLYLDYEQYFTFH